MADIKKKPTMKVTGLSAPTRGTGANAYQLTAKWSIPSDATKSSNEARIQGLDVYWEFRCYNLNSKEWKTLYYQKRVGNTSTREWTLYLNDFTCTDGKRYRRGPKTTGYVSFYPVDTYWCIRKVTVKVRGYNSKGAGPWVSVERSFEKPNQPSIESITQEPETGKILVKVSHDKGTGFKEIWDTKVVSSVYDSYTGKDLTNTGGESYLSHDDASDTFEMEDVYSRMRQSYETYLRVDVKAFARGLWGPSDEWDGSKTVKKSLFISWPQKPVISYLKVTDTLNVTSKITFDIKTGTNPKTEADNNEPNPHPTTGVRLEKLINVTYATASDIPGDAAWEECGAVDNGNCSALSSTVAELQPERGKYTWVRVKSWNQVEEIFYRYSEPLRMTQLERDAPTAADDSAIIYSAVSGDDGKSAVIGVAWGEHESQHVDDSTGTEIAWSTSPNAWRSNDEPDTYRVTIDDGSVTVGTTVYDHSATVHIAPLDEGTEYHFRCRRYHVDEDGDETFGDWYPEDTTVVVTPSSAPSSVTLQTAGYVRRGDPIQLTWTFESESEQKEWQVITGDTYTTTETTTQRWGQTTSTVTMSRLWIRELPYTSNNQTVNPNVTILASGTDSMGGCVIPWDDHLAEVIGSDDEIPLAVRVSTGGTFVTSEAVMVTVADPPELTMSLSTVTAQPLTFGVTCNVAAELAIVASSNYVAGGYAAGDLTQTEGDTVWSTVDRPEWTYSSSTQLYSATITAPMGLQLIDGATYTVTMRATDVDTGLTSDDVSADFAVNYSRKAPDPSDSISVVAYDVTDEGVRSRYAVITLAAPSSGISSDVYDVYRVTPDGPQLIAEGVLTNAVVTDPWAPYGSADLAYRVATRTVDGCESFTDFPYALPGKDLRVDFGDDYVELPYNLKVSDGYGKDFEARRHLDGSIDGYWNRGVERTSGLSTDVIKISEEDRVMAVRRLARHAGPCFVRLPDGSAYQADVQVSSISREAGNFAVAVQLNATAVDLTEYMATTPPEVES